MSYCKITLIGNLGRDVQLRYTPSGEPVADFSVAVSQKDKNGEHVDWYKVSVWGKRAEVANQYLAKGSQVYIEGRLKLVEYTDKEGNKRNSLEVTANEIQFLGKKGDGQATVTPQSAPVASDDDSGDDTIPF